MGRVLVVAYDGAQAVTGPEGGAPGVGVGLEHDERVEELAQPGPALDVGQPLVLVAMSRDCSSWRRSRNTDRGSSVADADPDRDRVDEQADHRLDAVQLRGPARDGRAEDHVVAPGEPRQQDAPGALDQGVDGQAAGLGREPSAPRSAPGSGAW